MAGLLASLKRLWTGGVARVTATQARDLLRSDQRVVVLDVRQAGEYRGGHLKGAKHTPVGLIPAKAQRMDKDATYLVYCQSGRRSARAARAMARAGIKDVRNLSGGIAAWRSMGYPIEK